MAWVLLAGAIVTELMGTLGLRALGSQPTWWAVALIAIAYTASFSCMAFSLRVLNVAVVYAIWSAVGMAGIAVAGVLIFHERLSPQAVAGIVVIALGVALLVASGSVRHA